MMFMTSCCFFSVFVAAFPVKLRLPGQVLRWRRHLMQPQLQVAVTWLAARTSLTENPGRAFSEFTNSFCRTSRHPCDGVMTRTQDASDVGRGLPDQGVLL